MDFLCFSESAVFFPDKEYRVAEDIGEILIPVHRTGDLSDETMVICSTVQGSSRTVSNQALLLKGLVAC